MAVTDAVIASRANRTPLGAPVDPDVPISTAMSSSSGGPSGCQDDGTGEPAGATIAGGRPFRASATAATMAGPVAIGVCTRSP